MGHIKENNNPRTYYHLLLLCVYVFKISASQSCNVNCNCATAGIVTCNQKLTSFPASLPGTTTSISLMGSAVKQNSIPSLKRSDLSGYPDLEDLDISYSQLNLLYDDVFQDTVKVERIYLKNNKITQMNVKVFQRTRDLLVLDLTGNKGCKISDSAFGSLSKLQSLFLGDLQLGTVSMDTFNGLTSLTELDLHGNSLKFLSVDVFKNMPNLRILDLSYNHIVILSDTFLPAFNALYRLDISENPWSCICDITWLKKLNSLAIFSTFTGSVAVCAEPYRLKYQAIHHVSDKDLTCIPPKILHCGDPYEVKLGNSLHINCKVEGNIFPNITWVRPDGTVIPGTYVPFSDPLYKTSKDVSVPSQDAVISDDGDWTIRAVNNKGTDVRTFHVHVEVPTTTTTTTTTSTSTPPVEEAEGLDTGFLIAAGGFGGTVLLGLIIFLSVVCCAKQTKNRVKPDKQNWNDGKYIDEMTFVVAPVSG